MTPTVEMIGELERQLDAAFAAMVRIAGGVDWLVDVLNKPPTYKSKISEGMYNRNGKRSQLRWIAPLLTDPAAGKILLDWLSDVLGYEPPIKKRVVTKEQIAEAAVEVISEMGALREAACEAIAKKLGVRPEDVKL